MTDLIAALRCGALEPWCGSQYSPRPPESALKKSPDLIPDQKASLSRLWTVTRHTPIKTEWTLDRLFPDSRMGVLVLFKSLGSVLARVLKPTDLMIFCSNEKKAPHQSADSKKNVEPLTLGATE
ncbi:hypothetical protein BLL42_21180 [Pseudomonas frederiksbergensis]|uniref:Uncharacterized protein n=1 Tax=Pseudomonas frederiksbergensis TaxID=104087 RepID=A0A1J0EPQ6_9PSED|nr:hypothetical protein [Pseudomonas frederiksbergensis]APC18114.1 hypothetical protein BLL42_21180 [Pseudomonas frederiksbergensis]